MVRPSKSTALFAAGVVGPALFVSVFLILGAITPGYDAVRDQVSRLLVSSVGAIQTVSAVASGLLLIAFSVGLATARGGTHSIGVALTVLMVAIGLIVAAVFPVGMEHVGGALLIFLGLTAACLVVAFGRARARRFGWAAYALLSGVVVFAFFRLAGEDWFGNVSIAAYAGLLQRISLITGMAFLATLSASAIRSMPAQEVT